MLVSDLSSTRPKVAWYLNSLSNDRLQVLSLHIKSNIHVIWFGLLNIALPISSSTQKLTSGAWAWCNVCAGTWGYNRHHSYDQTAAYIQLPPFLWKANGTSYEITRVKSPQWDDYREQLQLNWYCESNANSLLSIHTYGTNSGSHIFLGTGVSLCG